MRLAALIIALALGISGCTTIGTSSSVVGGFAGSQPRKPAPAAGQAIINALGGGLVAGASGQLSSQERIQALEAEYKALEYAQAGQPTVWGDLQGRRGEVRAATPYRVGSQDCRQYAHTIVLGGQPQVLRGTACRNSDGTWSLLT